VRTICDVCAAEPAPFDHLDLSGGEAVFKRLCQACGDAEKASWDAEQKRRPPRLLSPVLSALHGRQAA
jgi:protein-arginine kinase activator protein McsA